MGAVGSLLRPLRFLVLVLNGIVPAVSLQIVYNIVQKILLKQAIGQKLQRLEIFWVVRFEKLLPEPPQAQNQNPLSKQCSCLSGSQQMINRSNLRRETAR